MREKEIDQLAQEITGALLQENEIDDDVLCFQVVKQQLDQWFNIAPPTEAPKKHQCWLFRRLGFAL